MREAEEIYMPSTEQVIEALFRDIKKRAVSMMQLDALQDAERRVKKHYERLEKLEAVAEAARQLCTSVYYIVFDNDEDNIPTVRERDLDKLREALAALEEGDPS